jgi:SAM-dependent methyltransferase
MSGAEALRAAVDAYVGGRTPGPVAAMRLLGQARNREEALAACAGRAPDLEPLLDEAAFALVRRVLAEADHARAATPEAWAEVFDRLAELSPEAAVALYSLGDAERLEAATAEVVARIDAMGLLGPDRAVLEIGCGIGRFLAALAGRVDVVVGLDVSARMCAEAGRRTAPFPNAWAVRTGGRDLAALGSARFDLVLAVDSFPYLVNAGLAEVHLEEIARVLKPGGDLLVFNWAYDGGRPPERAFGLRRVAVDRAGFRAWDASAFRFHKTVAGRPRA